MITPLTKARYTFAYRSLVDWWRANDAVPTALLHLDEAVSSRLEALWSEGESVNAVADTLSALAHFLPFSHGWVRRGWKLLKTWRKVEPAHRCAPMTPLICLGLAGAAAQLERPDVAALLLVGFDGMMRSQSIFSLRRRHVSFYRDRAVVQMEATKTTARRGGVELIVIQAAVAVATLRAACAGLTGDQLVLRSSVSDFRRVFAGLIEVLGLNNVGVAVYSLRRGGASFDFLTHNSMERTLLRGHWQSTSAARVYVQDAAAEITNLRLSDSQLSDLKAAASWLDGLTAKAKQGVNGHTHRQRKRALPGSARAGMPRRKP